MVWYQRNYFNTQKLVHKDWIHQNVVINNKKWRLYDHNKYGCEHIFQNEMGQFFEYMVNQDLKIFYVKCSPKHDIKYTDECFYFFKIKRNNSNDATMPENLKKLRELQCSDLMYFYKNLILESFHIFSKIENDKYFYDIIIIVKNNFDINKFYKINFNIITIETITPIFYQNITYNYMQKIFDFEKLDKCAFYDILDQGYMDIVYNPKFEETQEYKNYVKYQQEQFKLGNYSKMQEKNSLYWYYSNESRGIKSEIMDQQLMFKYYFSNFGWLWFILNYNFKDMYAVEPYIHTYPINELFLLDSERMVKPMAVVKQGGEIIDYDEQYEIGCMFDLIVNLRETENYFLESYVISVPKILYNTSYKCRLKKTDE